MNSKFLWKFTLNARTRWQEEGVMKVTREEYGRKMIGCIRCDRSIVEDVETCEKCGRDSCVCEEIPMHGYSMTVCRKCYFSMVQTGEAV